MAYQATILNVMIASPSDVAEERQLVRDAIYEWNAIHSKQSNVMLNPVGWEHNVAPQMGSRPQEIINNSILNDSDILIGIFWTRIGSPTGEYVSGTIEEITKHCEKNKLASIYISQKPYPDHINLEQLQLLRDQKEIWLKEGLLDFYDNSLSFKQKIKDHLSVHIQKNEYIRTIVDKLNTTNTPIESSTKQTIEPSDEMIQILLNAGLYNDDVQFLRHLSGISFHVGKLSMALKDGRELAKWQDALDSLVEYGLLNNRGNKGELFHLTNEGWKAFDQLKEQQLEK
ncbi:DUF4062 domain-containing protein [Acinetobacter sp. ANC 4910]|uniref:DUF4062 domain-containing protein n=1 Tax=Acinetobacter sp. ANC 4910 TaxID=2529850 RepID=UPI00103C9C4F|nr:DUF4062 domain-containing protein [Acinetobacter sp. ANC 4910]TCB37007.1 DUF4062 domain-containing protein [Acinetobacter sp. ANC 4910]